jgi:hypothetical protein
MSFSFIAPKTWSVNLPPGMWRRCSSIAGGLPSRCGRIGHAVAAPRAVAQDELDVLAGAVLEVLVGRQLHAQHDHVGRRALDAHHAAGHLQHRVLAGAGHGARLDHAVGLRRGAAGQDPAGLFLVGSAPCSWCAPWITRPGQQAALARAAGAVAAAVGQADALADGRGQDRFVAVDAECGRRA